MSGITMKSGNLQDQVEADLKNKVPNSTIELRIKQVQAGIEPTTQLHPNLAFAKLSSVIDNKVTLVARSEAEHLKAEEAKAKAKRKQEIEESKAINLEILRECLPKAEECDPFGDLDTKEV